MGGGGGFGNGAGMSNWGIRSLADTFLNFYSPGMAAFLRYQNADTSSNPNFAALGFVVSVPTSGAQGFNDVQIMPQPVVSEVSKRDIGLSGGLLLFGAKTFQISATFVNQLMRQNNYTDPFQVFRDPLVMGIVYNQRLYSIVSIQQNDIGGQPLFWDIVANMVEQPASPSAPGEIPPPELGG